MTATFTTNADIHDQRERVLNASKSALDLAEQMRALGDEASARDLIAESDRYLAESRRLRALLR